MFIDVHCHLDYFKDSELPQIISKNKNLKIILSNGTNFESNERILKISEKFPQVKSALGLYPIEALKLSDKEISEVLNQIKSNKDKILAIGEVGMDFKESDEKEKQISIFKKIISLSIKLDKHLIVHSRKAELECIEILEKEKAQKVIMHCFSGKIKLAQRIISNNWFLSIPANIPNSQHFQKIVELTPITQLFCETDSPYLHPFREFPNYPYNVVESYKKIAEIKKLSSKEVENQIEKNFEKLFGCKI